MWLLLSLLVAGWAGSYGGARVEHTGFRAFIDASVGSLSDPTQEGPALEAGMKQAQRLLDENDAFLVAAYDRYATGDHAWKRLREHLAPFVVDGPTVVTGFEVGEGFDADIVQIDLGVAPGLSAVLREKMAADFALAQIGGALPAPPTRTADPTAAARLQAWYGANANVGVHGDALYGLLLEARRAEPELRLVATSSQPLAPLPYQEGYARPGWAVAKVIVALFDGSRPDEALPDLSGLPDETRAHLLRFAALVLSDAYLSDGTAAIAKAGAGLSTPRDGLLTDWLSALR